VGVVTIFNFVLTSVKQIFVINKLSVFPQGTV